MREVENDLIVGVGVNRGHGAADNLEFVVYNFGNRRQAVSGARGI